MPISVGWVVRVASALFERDRADDVGRLFIAGLVDIGRIYLLRVLRGNGKGLLEIGLWRVGT